jgi:hypothetical protein
MAVMSVLAVTLAHNRLSHENQARRLCPRPARKRNGTEQLGLWKHELVERGASESPGRAGPWPSFGGAPGLRSSALHWERHGRDSWPATQPAARLRGEVLLRPASSTNAPAGVERFAAQIRDPELAHELIRGNCSGRRRARPRDDRGRGETQ